MAWTELTDSEEPTVTIDTEGTIYWNEAARWQMGNPEWISLWHDAEGNRLGLMPMRNGSQYPRLQVRFDGGNYKIAAKKRLDAAGIAYRQRGTLIPPSETEDPIDASIHWVQLA